MKRVLMGLLMVVAASSLAAGQDTHRERIRALVSQIRHHETRENDLVQEAYYSSGATGD